MPMAVDRVSRETVPLNRPLALGISLSLAARMLIARFHRRMELAKKLPAAHHIG